MALTTITSNNKAIKFRRDITREFVRENLFSPYMGEDMTSIIRRLMDQKNAGEQVNIPIVTKLLGTAKSTGTLTGNEEAINNYGCRLYVDWARNAIKSNRAEQQKDSADIFGEAKPLLADWGKELQRDEIVAAFMALPTESAPAGLGSGDGQRINGILYEDATAAQRNTWNADNSDRVLFGNLLSNYSATHATALANVDTTNDTFVAASIRLLKGVCKKASPKIRPYKLTDGREYYVCFAGSNNFGQMQASLETINKDARPREGGGMDKNPIFQDGDLLYDGMIIREIPEIEDFVTNSWTSLLTAGATSSRVAPVFVCGQSALAMPWAQMPQPTTLDDTDYQFNEGVGVQMCYGVGKVFTKPLAGSTKLVQFGMATGFFSSANPS